MRWRSWKRFRFDDDELGYLRDAVGLDDQALAALAGLRFTGDVWAVPEGRVVFADEPLLEVTAPIARGATGGDGAAEPASRSRPPWRARQPGAGSRPAAPS